MESDEKVSYTKAIKYRNNNNNNVVGCVVSPDELNARRYRTAFTREQLDRLEKEFIKENYLSRPRRSVLSSILNLSESTIKVTYHH